VEYPVIAPMCQLCSQKEKTKKIPFLANLTQSYKTGITCFLSYVDFRGEKGHERLENKRVTTGD
jgi:hypothetical protein